MPKEGAAILSQVQGLLEQFMALDYDTPVKDKVSQWLDEVNAAIPELRAQAEDQEPEASDKGEGEGGSPLSNLGDSLSADREAADQRSPSRDGRAAFAKAREDAGAMLRKRNEESKNGVKASDNEEQPKKKKKAGSRPF